MPVNPQDVFERYVWAATTRNAEAVAELFTPDGVLEAPLMPPGRRYPHRLCGRAEIRAGLAAYYAGSAPTDLRIDLERSRYALHATTDPDVFIAEIDTVFSAPVPGVTMALVQIFRLRDGQIRLMRDYFAPHALD